MKNLFGRNAEKEKNSKLAGQKFIGYEKEINEWKHFLENCESHCRDDEKK